MQEIQERACLAANRVDLVVGFVTGASITLETYERVLDGFRVTQELLLHLQQSGQRDEFARFLASRDTVVQPAEDVWSPLVAGQVKLWQASRLNQKTIETVGDLMSAWQPKVVHVDEFDAALNQLEFITTLEPESQAKIWADDGQESLSVRMTCFSQAVTGLAVIAANNTATGDDEAFAGVCFGASLVVENISKITLLA